MIVHTWKRLIFSFGPKYKSDLGIQPNHLSAKFVHSARMLHSMKPISLSTLCKLLCRGNVMIQQP